MTDERLAQALLDRLVATAPRETGEAATPVVLAELCGSERALGYAQATLDLLRLLGVVQGVQVGEPAVVTSTAAGYLLRLLRELSATGEPLVADWHSLGVDPTAGYGRCRGVDLLAALERRRLELSPEAAPLRHVQAVIAMIAGRNAWGEPALLCHWDTGAQMWQLVGGHYEAHDGSLRAAMLRELAEELESDSVGADPDLQLSELGPPFAIERSSPTYGLLTRTVFQAYMLRWPAASLVTGERLRWVTAAELERERTTDARPISAAPVRLLAARERVTIAALIEVLSV